jgi:type VI secretion system secreted protein VgrG
MPAAGAPEPKSYVLKSAVTGLELRSATCHEEMSRLFEFHVVALSLSNSVAPDDILGTEATIEIATGDNKKRLLHGLVTSFGIDGVDGRRFRYRLVIRPWLWLATRASNLRIFQNKNAMTIINEVLEPYGGTVTPDVQATPATRIYCVQYRESDFNFVVRLLEEEGIGWFFKHSAGKHELVLTDHNGTFAPHPDGADVLFLEDGQDPLRPPGLHEWSMRHEIQTGKSTLRDYDYLNPSTDLLSETATASNRAHAHAAYEAYDYPGLYTVEADGTARAKVRLDEAMSRFARFQASGNLPTLAVGQKISLTNHPRDDQNADYTVLRTQLELSQGGFESGDAQTLMHMQCEVQPYAEPYRPQRITRKPSVAGPQTAVVVGGGNPGSIETDEHARVKVQFHWDRLGRKNAESSCWVRVASPWAGNGWGFLQIPRVGQEVVVDFLEGDPDQPLIVGRVHNAEQKPPYELPANSSVSTIKSRSIEGATDKFNELRFEDKANSEYLLMQSQKDKFEFVEETTKTLIGKFEHRTVVEDSKEHIKGALHQHVVKDVFQKYDKSQNLDVKEKLLVKTGDVFSVKATKDLTMASDATISLKSAQDMHIKSGPNMGLEAAANVYVKGGANVVIEAAAGLTLKVGGSFVVVNSGGVFIKGPIVQINTGGAAGSGTAPSPVATTDPAAAADAEEPEDPLSHR